MSRKSDDKIARRWGSGTSSPFQLSEEMEQQKDAHEASVKVACVSPMHFYSLLVKGGTNSIRLFIDRSSE